MKLDRAGSKACGNGSEAVSATMTGARLRTLTRVYAAPTTPYASRASTRKIQSPEIAAPSVSISTRGAAAAGAGGRTDAAAPVSSGAVERRLDAPAEREARRRPPP